MAYAKVAESRAHSIGGLISQELDFTLASGDTAASVVATSLSRIVAVVVGSGGVQHSSAPTYSGNTATLAVVVPTATAATLTLDGVTVESVALSQSGNLITLAYTGGATAGAEVVTVVGNAISVQIESGVSTITQVRTAINAAPAAAALVTATGTSGTAVSTASATPLTGGITGGAFGTIVCLGY